MMPSRALHHALQRHKWVNLLFHLSSFLSAAELQGEHRMREALGEQLARYEAVCLGGDNDGAWDPTLEDMITLSESFHLCVAVQRK